MLQFGLGGRWQGRLRLQRLREHLKGMGPGMRRDGATQQHREYARLTSVPLVAAWSVHFSAVPLVAV